jgi:hypothetical protein
VVAQHFNREYSIEPRNREDKQPVQELLINALWFAELTQKLLIQPGVELTLKFGVCCSGNSVQIFHVCRPRQFSPSRKFWNQNLAGKKQIESPGPD